MGVFRPYDPQDKATAGESDPESTSRTGKGVPTPTRKQAEAARRQRVNPVLSKKEEKAKDRDLRRSSQQKAMAAQDQRPERVLLRDFIDARFNVTEFLLPTWLVVFAVSLLATKWPVLIEYSAIAAWLLLVLAVIDLLLMWRGYKKLLNVRHPGASTRGLLMVGINRALSIRPWRVPAPRIKRGTKL